MKPPISATKDNTLPSFDQKQTQDLPLCGFCKSHGKHATTISRTHLAFEQHACKILQQQNSQAPDSLRIATKSM